MKTRINFLLITQLLVIMLITSCKKEDIIIVEASDLSVSIVENPIHEQVIGKVIGTTNEGSVTFSIITQTPLNAFSINTSSGELKVSDETLFDFETNPTITGTVRVANEEIYKDVTIEILVYNEVGTLTIDSSELITTIDENPPNDFFIGNLYATSNEGDITFSFIEQTPTGALKFGSESVIDGISIITDDETLFFYETNPILSATIRVSNGETYQDVNLEVTLNDVTTYTELVDCEDCIYLAVKGDYLYIAKQMQGIYKLNVIDYTGELIEVVTVPDNIYSIAIIDNFLYKNAGSIISRIDLNDTNPTWELFYEYPSNETSNVGLTSNGSDLYFYRHAAPDLEFGFIYKLNTIGSPELSAVCPTGETFLSMAFTDSSMYDSSIGYWGDYWGIAVRDLTTYELTSSFIQWDDEEYTYMTLASSGNHVYMTYFSDIYRINTENDVFTKELAHIFEVKKYIKKMIFLENNLYCIRDNKIGMLNLEYMSDAK